MTRATRRGHDFEYRVAKLVDGLVYAGQDGDVEVPGTDIRIECKYSDGFGYMRFKEWHDQIAAYEAKAKGKRFVLAYSGGKSYQNARIWFSVPDALFTDFITFLRWKSALHALSSRASVLLEKLLESELQNGKDTSNGSTFTSDRGIGE